MYIRRVPTRNITTGDSYFTHRLVRTERIGNRVRQVTLLNLGRHFAVAQEDWPSLCPRIEESRPFNKPESGKIAVKVINHYGDEVLKVFEI